MSSMSMLRWLQNRQRHGLRKRLCAYYDSVQYFSSIQPSSRLKECHSVLQGQIQAQVPLPQIFALIQQRLPIFVAHSDKHDFESLLGELTVHIKTQTADYPKNGCNEWVPAINILKHVLYDNYSRDKVHSYLSIVSSKLMATSPSTRALPENKLSWQLLTPTQCVEFLEGFKNIRSESLQVRSCLYKFLPHLARMNRDLQTRLEVGRVDEKDILTPSQLARLIFSLNCLSSNHDVVCELCAEVGQLLKFQMQWHGQPNLYLNLDDCASVLFGLRRLNITRSNEARDLVHVCLQLVRSSFIQIFQATTPPCSSFQQPHSLITPSLITRMAQVLKNKSSDQQLCCDACDLIATLLSVSARAHMHHAIADTEEGDAAARLNAEQQTPIIPTHNHSYTQEYAPTQNMSKPFFTYTQINSIFSTISQLSTAHASVQKLMKHLVPFVCELHSYTINSKPTSQRGESDAALTAFHPVMRAHEPIHPHTQHQFECVTAHHVASLLYGTQNMSADGDGAPVTQLFNSLIVLLSSPSNSTTSSSSTHNIRLIAHTLTSLELSRICIGLKNCNGSAWEVRVLLQKINAVLTEKIRMHDNTSKESGQPNMETMPLTPICISNVMYGMHQFNLSFKVVGEFWNLFATILQTPANLKQFKYLTQQESANILYGLHSWQGDYDEVRRMLRLLCQGFRLQAEHLNSLSSNHTEGATPTGQHLTRHRPTSASRLRHTAGHEVPIFTPLSVQTALFGLRRLESKYDEMRQLLQMLTSYPPLVLAMKNPEFVLSGQGIAMVLFGLRECSSAHPEVRAYIRKIILPLLRRNVDRCTNDAANGKEDEMLLTPLGLCMMMQGIRGLSTEHEETRQILALLSEYLTLSRKTIRSSLMEGSLISCSLNGLRLCSAEHEEVKTLLTRFLTVCMNGPERVDVDEQDRLDVHLSMKDVKAALFGLQSMDFTIPEVRKVWETLYEMVSH